ncbi:predicted protein [Naegleria gruberi]|uniref:Predicted protein n=1 Tax=Naegleria gruberi TaxID=5762 RepID=D2VLX3_NAEGR|nr:uncharacterized protein NAEGRDRAFT_69931 [Naegleria gruberi]EFC42129.1 predicted protein [Naegleria gruberi]|eukprot:XP_002674873.1 predicted protein [Naegleria gruberi strain NEG-M]
MEPVNILLIDFNEVPKNFSSSSSSSLIGMLFAKFQNQSKGFRKWLLKREDFLMEIALHEKCYLDSHRVGFTYIDPVYLNLSLEFIHDWEIIEQLIDYVPSQYLPASCATRQFWKKLLGKRGCWFSSLPQELKQDRELIMSAVGAGDCEIFSSLPIELVNDLEFMRECIKIEGSSLLFCRDEEVKRELNFEAVCMGLGIEFLKRDENGKVIDFGDQFNDDREVVLENLKRNGSLFQKVSNRLKDDKILIIEAMKTSRSILTCLSNEMKQDEEIINAAIQYNQFQTLKCYFESKNYVKDYEKDVEMICKVLAENGSDYGYLPSDYKQDKDLHLRIFKIHTSFIERFPKEMLQDKEIILEAVKNPPTGFLPFSSASYSLKQDEEFVKQVIELSPSSIVVVHNNLKKNRSLVMQAVKQQGGLLQFCSHFRKDREMLSIALTQVTQNKLTQDEFDFLFEESIISKEMIPTHSKQLLEIVAKFDPHLLMYNSNADADIWAIAAKYTGTIPPSMTIEEMPMLFEQRLEYEYCGFYLPPRYKSHQFD